MTRENVFFSLYLMGMVALGTFLASDGLRLTLKVIIDTANMFWAWWG